MASHEKHLRPTYEELEKFVRFVNDGLERGVIKSKPVIDLNPAAITDDGFPVVSLHSMSRTLVEKLAIVDAAAMSSAGGLQPTEADRQFLDDRTLAWAAGRCEAAARFAGIPLSFQTAASEFAVFFRGCIGVAKPLTHG